MFATLSCQNKGVICARNVGETLRMYVQTTEKSMLQHT